MYLSTCENCGQRYWADSQDSTPSRCASCRHQLCVRPQSGQRAECRAVFYHFRLMSYGLWGHCLRRATRRNWVRTLADARGGATVCQLFDGDEVVSVGVAYCSPKDNYNKRTGRELARRRAEDGLEIEQPGWLRKVLVRLPPTDGRAFGHLFEIE